MENIRDWCISRQLWWGHRIPVWYCQDCGETIVVREDPSACTACGSKELEQDPDVLDTWFSSWLWPFSIFGWPEKTEDLKAFYPGHVLSTAPEILFFWVARMIMAGYEFMGEAPFKTVYLHATVRDTLGRKMSKSLGNGIDPLEVVDQFGADALRFTVISAAAVGTDIQLNPNDLEASFAPGRNFANKVWNAGRFTLMSVGDDPVKPLAEVKDDLELSDRWILSRLSWTAESLTQELEKFRLHDVAEKAYHFFWGELADWYLELVKPRLREDADEASKEAARTTLITVLDGILRLLHPIIPFVTEELWQKLPWPAGMDRPESLISAPWPTRDPGLDDPEAERQLEAVRELITQVRSLRKEYGVPEGAEVEVEFSGAPGAFQGVLGSEGSSIRRLARVADLRLAAEDGAAGAGAHAVLKNGTDLFIPLAGVIDLEKERDRLAAEIERLSGQLQGVRAKLRNENFVSRAPEEVVSREREKETRFQEQMEKLQEKLRVFEGA
jgi:valyl-tRNA synthetase